MKICIHGIKNNVCNVTTHSEWVLYVEAILLSKQTAFVVMYKRVVASLAQLLAKTTLFYIIKLIKNNIYNYFKLLVTHKNITLR